MRRLTILMIMLFSIAGCGRVLQKEPLSTENITISQIRERVKENYSRLNSIRTKARIIAEMPGLGFTAMSEAVLKMPDQLKVEIRAGFGMGVGSIRLEGQNFIVYSAMENRAYYGNIDSTDISRFFQINLGFRELLNLLSGSPYFSDNQNTKLTIDDNKYLIHINSEDRIKKYWIDPEKFVITDFQLYAGPDSLIFSQELRNYRKSRGIYLPKLIRVTHPQGHERLTVMFEERSINQKIDANEFYIKIPENAEKVKL